MIGVNKSEPEPFKVNYRSLSEKFKFGWQFVGQSLTLRCDYTNRRTTSKREGFDTQNAHHINYGISGVFTLPAGFGISTDFMCYTRRGYGVSYLDTTDPVWNVRLSYCPPTAQPMGIHGRRVRSAAQAIERQLCRHRHRPNRHIHQLPATLPYVQCTVPAKSATQEMI